MNNNNKIRNNFKIYNKKIKFFKCIDIKLK